MDSGIPAPLSATLLFAFSLLIVLRLALLSSNLANKRLNIALASMAVSCALRDPTVQSAVVGWSGSRLAPVMLYHLSEFAASPILGALFLVAYAWINRSEPRYLARAVYAALTVGAIAVLVLKLYAWSKIDAFTVDPSLAVVAYSYSNSALATTATMFFYDVLFCCFSVMLLIASARELRNKPDRRAFAVITGMALIAVGLLVQTAGFSIAGIMAALGRRNAFIDTVGMAVRASVGVYGVLLTAVAAVPVVIRLFERLHLDKYSRQRRRLLPLWRDLTTACPEIVFMERGVLANDPRYQLHRTVIEIRDSILILSRYANYCDSAAIHISADDPELQQAVRLALAWSARISGNSPSNEPAARQSAATDLVEETQELTEIADRWLEAKATLELTVRPTVAAR